MFGWEFPPYNSGGLGVACKGLAQALAAQNNQVIFVLPRQLGCKGAGNLNFLFADESEDNLRVVPLNFFLTPYLNFISYHQLVKDTKIPHGSDLFEEVARYSKGAVKIALNENFDVIHAHDWLSFPAALAALRVSKKPLIVHVHATEFDRGGGSANTRVYEIEKEGLERAHAVIAVSNYTKNKIIKHYGVSPQKIRVVYNAIDQSDFPELSSWNDLIHLKKDGKQFILFVGRITIQKGPDYFLKAAKLVIERNPNVRFIIVGTGDMEKQIIEEAAWLGIAEKVFFVGFMERGERLSQLYRLADLYVLPSVSEPFGLTVLEALWHGTPILISKQSGVAEVLSHCLKIDFWDINDLANKMLAVLKHRSLQDVLRENGRQEIKKFSWDDSARSCVKIYQEVLSGPNNF